ncbi:MAG: hypothetical protein LBP68_08850 [Acidobacteriota bacterium]|jgi:hypothetical protein|nr:hypothetical protein [Acidobacteriota bacterium]
MTRLKFLPASLALLLLGSVVMAQSTPEAVIGQVPDLPSAATLAAARSDSESSAGRAVNDFVKRVNALDKRNDENYMPEISESEIAQATSQAVSDAEKQAKALTGKSIAQLENMSEAELAAVGQKAAKKAVSQNMSAVGMGDISLGDLMNMSEGDLMAKMASNMGLTAAELKAMENMSDAQAEAYMKQGDRMQRVSNSNAAKAAQKNQGKAPKVSEADANALMKAPEEQQKFLQRVEDMRKLVTQERGAFLAKFDEINAKHSGTASYQSAQKIASDCNGKSSRSAAECDAAYAILRAARVSADTECFGLWRNQIAKEQGRIKTLLPDAARVDALTSQATQATARLNQSAMSGISQKFADAGTNQHIVVNAYLASTMSVTNYPEER